MVAAANAPTVVAVLGAGTMGVGIAQLAAQAGARTLLYDPVPEALEGGIEKIASGLAKLVTKGKLESADAAAIQGRVESVEELGALTGVELVIEAAPERLDLKLELLGTVAEIVGPKAVLATNTSSLSVTEIAAGVPGSDRVVGMHFFNPAPAMKLVEVVPGADSAPAALATARALGQAMGKHVIDAADVAGFLVNRCNRPYSLESLKLLEERVASVDQIDRIARLGGGFRMGPFELMDLIGIETNHAVAEVLRAKSYGEPRYRPSPLSASKIGAGELGRKSGRGWYDYDRDVPHRPADPKPPSRGGGGGRPLSIRGALPAAEQLRSLAVEAGWSLAAAGEGEAPWLTIDFGEPPRPAAGPRLRHLHDGSLHALDPAAAGFHLMPPLAAAAELTRTELTEPLALERAEELIASLGMLPEQVGDAPGLVLGRVVCQLVNEAAFLIGEGHGTSADVDAGLELGANHPRGPIAWSRELGLAHVVALLDALREELGEERYRAAPLLRRRLTVGGELG